MEFIIFLTTIVGLLSILYGFVMFVTKGNRDFFKLIDDFHLKLPPEQKKAREGVDKLSGFSTINTTNMKLNLNTEQIDLFQKKLEIFKYNRIIFKKKAIISYSNNLQRLLKASEWKKFGIAIIQSILEDNKLNKPYILNRKISKIIGF